MTLKNQPTCEERWCGTCLAKNENDYITKYTREIYGIILTSRGQGCLMECGRGYVWEKYINILYRLEYIEENLQRMQSLRSRGKAQWFSWK